MEVHPKYQQRELRQYCKAHNIAVVAYAAWAAATCWGIRLWWMWRGRFRRALHR